MKSSLTDVAGIGESTALLLNEHGIASVKALCKGGVKKLVQVPGFGKIRASAVISAADTLRKSNKGNKKDKTKKQTKVITKSTKKAAKGKTPKSKKRKKSDKSKKTRNKKADKKRK